MSIKVKSSKRKATWEFLLAFLLGCIFAELTSDPLSDTLFFWRSSQGPLTPMEQVLYWYFLPACIYTFIFVLAFFIMCAGGKAKDFTFIIIAFAGMSLALSWKILGGSIYILLMLLIPLIALAYVLTHRTLVKVGRRWKMI